MKVYFLRLDSERNIFYGESSPQEASDAEAAEQTPGVRGYVSRQYAKLQRLLRESESGVGLRMRRIWEWLHRRTAPDESLIRSLRGAAAIHLYHPADLTAEAARAAWERYLGARRRYFTLWLTLNLLVVPLSLLLVPIPGPNVLGYWFAYRAICHALALMGIQRARSVEVETHGLDLLNPYLSEADAEDVDRLARACDLNELAPYLERMTVRSEERKKGAEKLVVPSRPGEA